MELLVEFFIKLKTVRSQNTTEARTNGHGPPELNSASFFFFTRTRIQTVNHEIKNRGRRLLCVQSSVNFQILIVASSEHEANRPGSLGCHLTPFTSCV